MYRQGDLMLVKTSAASVVGQFADLRRVTVSPRDVQRRCLIYHRHRLAWR